MCVCGFIRVKVQRVSVIVNLCINVWQRRKKQFAQDGRTGGEVLPAHHHHHQISKAGNPEQANKMHKIKHSAVGFLHFKQING